VALATVVLLVAIGGCGSSTTARPTVTKKQFIQRAHAICYRLSKKQVRRMEAFEKERHFQLGELGQGELEEVNTAVVMPIVQEKIEALDALPAPEGDEGRIQRILRAMERAKRQAEAHPEWLAAPSAAHPEPFQEAGELVAAYGVWLCAQP
jgi:hypothetical protein